MDSKLYVGNLPFSATGEALRELFSQAGTVTSSDVIMDRISGRSKGFGFVEMADEQAAEAAIATLNNQEFEGRRLRVNVAENKPRDARPRYNNNGGGYGDRY